MNSCLFWWWCIFSAIKTLANFKNMICTQNTFRDHSPFVLFINCFPTLTPTCNCKNSMLSSHFSRGEGFTQVYLFFFRNLWAFAKITMTITAELFADINNRHDLLIADSLHHYFGKNNKTKQKVLTMSLRRKIARLLKLLILFSLVSTS